MFIFEKDIGYYQSKGYKFLSPEEIPVLERELMLANYKFFEPVKEEFYKNKMQLNDSLLASIFKSYLENNELTSTNPIMYYEKDFSLQLIKEYIISIHKKDIFIPIYLVSLFIRNDYMRIYQSIDTFKDKDYNFLNELCVELNFNNNKRLDLYEFLSNENNLKTLIKYVGKNENRKYNNEDYKNLFNSLIYVTNTEIDATIIYNFLKDSHDKIIEEFIEYLISDFEKSMIQVFKNLNIDDNYVRKEVKDLVARHAHAYNLLNQKIHLINISNTTKKNFLVHENNILNVLFVL